MPNLPLPPNSFPLNPLVGVQTMDYAEGTSEMKAVELYLSHAEVSPYLSRLVPDITSPKCTLRAYKTFEHAVSIEMKIVAHFADDESGMLFRIKHGMTNCRSLPVDKNANSEK